jgi:hypothetical protein
MSSSHGQLWLFPRAENDSAAPEFSSARGSSFLPQQEIASAHFCVLGSGSSGNCAVLAWRWSLDDGHGEKPDSGLLLLDLGLSPGVVRRRLCDSPVSLDRLTGACLTHADGDHLHPQWLGELIDRSVPLFIHRKHIHAVYRIDRAREAQRLGLLRVFDGQAFEPTISSQPSPLAVRPVALPHDANGSQAFVLRFRQATVCYATDMGTVPDALLDAMVGSDLLAIESNYDTQMQRDSARSAKLKQRVMGPRGHLSNEQAFEALVRVMDLSGPRLPRHVVLLHRSRQCNTPSIVRSVFERDARLAPRLVLADQHQATPWLCVYEGSGLAQPRALLSCESDLAPSPAQAIGVRS